MVSQRRLAEKPLESVINLPDNYQAIVICGGAPNPAIDIVKNKLDIDTTYFIGVDRGAIFLLEAGLPLTLAVGDFDSISEEELKQVKNKASYILESVPEKDDTDMELALQKIVQGGDDIPQDVPIYLIGGLGEFPGRIDHLLANLFLVYQPRYQSLVIRLRFIEDQHDMRFYQPGCHQLDYQPDTKYLSIISLTPVENLEIAQAKYSLDSTDLSFPRAYISNEFKETKEPIQLSFSTGLVAVMWVGDQLDHQFNL